jgi:predicted deacetylase
MRHFSLEDQTLLVAKGIEQLRACGVDNVHSFRAGGYGANVDTLHALARNGVRYDSSHNAS